MVSTGKFVCVDCREVFAQTHTCPRCGEEMANVGYRWRPPKKKNHKAWARVEEGNLLWNHRDVIKAEAKRFLGWEEIVEKRKEHHRKLRNRLKDLTTIWYVVEIADFMGNEVKAQRVRRWLEGGGIPRMYANKINDLYDIYSLGVTRRQVVDLYAMIKVEVRYPEWGADGRRIPITERLGLE